MMAATNRRTMPSAQCVRVLATLLTLGMLGAGAGSAAAQTNESDFRAYPLRYLQAGDVQQSLKALVGPDVELITDAKFNRILVRGSAQAQQIVKSTLETLDQPKTSDPAATAPAASAPVLKVYSVNNGNVLAAADWLRGQFSREVGVRVAADPRTGQLLVYAPPQLQPQIAYRLGEAPAMPRPPAATAADRSASAAAEPAQAAFSQTVQLQQQPAQQIEAALMKALGDRMTAARAPGPSGAAYCLHMAGGGLLTVDLDYSANRVTIQGNGTTGPSCVRLIQTLDQASADTDGSPTTRFVALRTSKPADIRRAVDAIETSNNSAARPAGEMGDYARRPGAMLSMMIQKPGEGDTGAAAAQPAPYQFVQAPPQPQPGLAPGPGPTGAARPRGTNPAGLVGPVQIEMLDGLDVLVMRGNPRDVEQIMQIIQQIEKLSTETEPSIEIYPLQHVDGESLAFLVNQLYAQVFSARQGNVTITALIKPNVLLLVGRPENVRTALDLIKRLDQPVAPETQFQVFPLKHASAMTAQATVQDFFTSRGGLSTRARVTADFRSNSLIVQASPGDVADVAALINKLDTPTSDAVNELRVFDLEHSLATDVANILQYAISSPMGGMGARPGMPATGAGAGGAGGMGALGAMAGKSAMLRFVTVDAKGQKILNSGILTDVRITPDMRSNSILVSAPADSMDLIGALIRELDQRPAAAAAIKVFTIVNADVAGMVNILYSVFGQTGGGFQPGLVQSGGGEGESSIIPLRFAYDVRTNSIIASGSQSDLGIVEAILLRLDESDVRQRKTTVYRLKNSPAQDVANAINNLVSAERQIQNEAPGLVSPFEQLEREVVVVPEFVSNSLIVSATPRFYEEIQALVEKLDQRPPMVMIQVLVAQVQLNDFNEFGIELGLQDSLLFDRSVLSAINTLTTTSTAVTNNGTGGTTTVTSQNQQVIGGTLAPGYGFNNQPVGNSAAGANTVGLPNSLGTAGNVAGQGLSNFGVGRTNSTLGYGGLVLSASSDSVSALLRALQQDERIEVLSRPQIMTLDNQAAYIQVGQRVPRVNSSSITTAGNQINTITLENVGLILGVTPRISPDGLVVMELDAEKSALEPLSSGIPISVLTNGQVITSPIIDITTAQTTVSAVDGQTPVFAGMISKEKDVIKRRVPYLSDIPVLGSLFRYDSTTKNRTELLIIMTPHIIKTEDDMDRMKRLEASRMSWCLADAESLHGDLGVRGRNDHWHDSETQVVYPDQEPGAPQPAPSGKPSPTPTPGSAEMIPTPPEAPQAERKPQNVHVDESVPSLNQPQSPAGQKSSQSNFLPQNSQQAWQGPAPIAGPGWQSTPTTTQVMPPVVAAAAPANYTVQQGPPQAYGGGVMPAAYGAQSSAPPGSDGSVRPAAYGAPQQP